MLTIKKIYSSSTPFWWQEYPFYSFHLLEEKKRQTAAADSLLINSLKPLIWTATLTSVVKNSLWITGIVRQRLDAELLKNVYLHSGTILAIKRANSIFPIIEPILKEEGVPDNLKYLAVAESVLSNAISPAGAKGIWQFMKPTAGQFGLEVSEEVDQRYRLEKATHAACKYLKGQKEQLGSWVLAAAAYNAGPGRIKQDKESQRANSFFEMNLAADETMRYPFRIVAIKEVMQHPDVYEYNIDKEHLYPVIPKGKTIEVNEPVANWGDFARTNGTNYRELKRLNPWLTAGKLTNKEHKTYKITVPE